jgi:hypothetical protein
MKGVRSMNYIKIDFNEVEGYNKLSDDAKKVFERVYKAHNSAQGNDYKEKYIPTSVKEHKEYLEVHFKDGEWLHYTANGEWY